MRPRLRQGNNWLKPISENEFNNANQFFQRYDDVQNKLEDLPRNVNIINKKLMDNNKNDQVDQTIAYNNLNSVVDRNSKINKRLSSSQDKERSITNHIKVMLYLNYIF